VLCGSSFYVRLEKKMSLWARGVLLWILFAVGGWSAALRGGENVEKPFVGITHISRTETSPRILNIHIVKVDLKAPGIGFILTSPGGTRETVRQTTLDFLNQQRVQVAINSHFFLPFPSSDSDVWLIGLAASRGKVYSSFEAPLQFYAIVANAPAINIDSHNHANIVHSDTRFADGKHVRENVRLWNAVSGSAQIITSGVRTIPTYADARNPGGDLTPGGSAPYSNSDSWYDRLRARTAIGLSKDKRTLFLFTVDEAAGGKSGGMKVGEVADLLIRDYGVYNALNLDGGGSTTLVMEDPVTHAGVILNVSSDNSTGRPVGSSLGIFAVAATKKGTVPFLRTRTLRWRAFDF
jgi:Phosphodiester glycosidase